MTGAISIIRRLGGNGLGIALSLVILTIAAVVLCHAMQNIDRSGILDALNAQSGHEIVNAVVFVIAGYVALFFYDVFALRTIGRNDVPFQTAAFASFTSYTIGHALGAATLTAGIIRLRLYSSWGLNVLDIAKIAFITSMTFGLGTALMLGGALAYAPAAASAVDQLPAWINRTAGLSALLGIAGYLTWVMPRPRVIGRANWRIVLPDLRFTLVQIAIGATDLTLVTLAMYMLLPPSPAVGFPTILVIFLIATLLGVVSHAPGGLGVTEAVLLLGLPQFRKEELLATLLTFRVLYFLIPLCLAALFLSLRELRLIARAPAIVPQPRLPPDLSP